MAEHSAEGSAGEFPRFTDGDVLIHLTPSRQYQLHASTLKRHSTFFKSKLVEGAGAQLSSKARREGTTIRWRLNLKLTDPNATHGDLVAVPLNDKGRPVASQMHGLDSLTDLDAGRLAPQAYHHYDNMFRAYYYKPVQIGDADIREVLHDIVGLTEVAESLGSVQVVSLSIDNALVKQGQVLYRSIAASSAAWADLAYRVRSELIFREAVIHIVGQWRMLLADEDKPIDRMVPAIRAVCVRKAAELDDMKQAAEIRIMGHYPTHMSRPVNNNVGPGSLTIRGTGKSTRANSYQTDMFAWMALNLFRHWLGQKLAGDGRHALDGGYAMYMALAAGGDAYIDHGAVESFTQFFPLSAKARNAFEAQLSIVKEGARPFVASIVENRSMMDVSKWPLKYLTCLEVTKKDLPWAVADDERTTAGYVAAPAHGTAAASGSSHARTSSDANATPKTQRVSQTTPNEVAPGLEIRGGLKRKQAVGAAKESGAERAAKRGKHDGGVSSTQLHVAKEKPVADAGDETEVEDEHDGDTEPEADDEPNNDITTDGNAHTDAGKVEGTGTNAQPGNGADVLAIGEFDFDEAAVASQALDEHVFSDILGGNVELGVEEGENAEVNDGSDSAIDGDADAEGDAEAEEDADVGADDAEDEAEEEAEDEDEE